MSFMSVPPGLSSIKSMPYGYQRWNGCVWHNRHVDVYNKELERIVERHSVGYDVTRLVDGLYSLANSFDVVNRELDRLDRS